MDKKFNDIISETKKLRLLPEAELRLERKAEEYGYTCEELKIAILKDHIANTLIADMHEKRQTQKEYLQKILSWFLFEDERIELYVNSKLR